MTPQAGPVVVVTGAGGGVGSRVLDRLAGDPRVTKVVALDLAPIRVVPARATRVEPHRVDLTRHDLDLFVEGADVVVHLAFEGATERVRGRAARVNVEGTRRLLEAASAAGVPHVVLLSAAAVYGAWPNNPVPITEDVPLRPNPDLALAVQRAQAEHLVDDWRLAEPGRSVAVLRPTTVLGTGRGSWIASALIAASGLRAREDDPPKQFVHADDVAAAVVLAALAPLDGSYNVAPEGWISADVVRELVGKPPRLGLPAPVAAAVDRWRWRFLGGPIPPGLLPFTEHPVVVASDRLRAAGWTPRYTNDEALVAGTDTPWWTMVSPKRRQELTLAGFGVLVALVLGGAGVAARAGLRRRRHRLG